MTDTMPAAAASPPSLFFEGSIESAISSSLTRSLPLACFIADDGSESSTWQNEYMEDEEVLPLLRSRCVLLKLQAGSVEAGFLQAFCPIQTVPYLVVIRNGTMVANIKAGAVKDAFTAGVKAALLENETVAAPASPPQPADVASLPPQPQPQPSSSTTPSQPSQPQSQPSQAQSQPSQAQSQPSQPQPSQPQPQPQPQPSARRDSTTPVPSSSRRESSAGHLAYLEQQRKRQLAAAEDRKRVLQLLENDKIERRQRASTTSTSAAPAQSTRHSTPPPPRATPEETALSFRLLDGSSLKSRFASTATLATEVRRWLDEHRTDNSDHPYSFLQIMAPMPNKQLSLSDEGSTLAELGLAPTATLVLVPAQSYVSAYNGGGTSNEVGFLSRAYSLIYGAVTTVLGVGYPATPAPAVAPPAAPAAPAAAAPAPAEAPPSLGATLGRAGRSEARETQSVSRASSANGRIRTLYNAAEEAGGKEDTGRKYYNGNQLDFEPKRDEKGKERKE